MEGSSVASRETSKPGSGECVNLDKRALKVGEARERSLEETRKRGPVEVQESPRTRIMSPSGSMVVVFGFDIGWLTMAILWG